MNFSSMNSAGRQIVLGVLLVSFVTLITFAFSFLGTLLAGAMVGMMAGFAKQWRWQFLLVSLVFPAALLASMHVAKGNLHDSARLAAVCFGDFWATYLVTRSLFYLEKQGAPAAKAPAAANRVALPNVAVHPAAPRLPVPQATLPLVGDPDLRELQGRWSREATAPDGKPCRKVIEVDHQALALSLIDRAGKVRFVTKGDVTVEKLGTFKMVKVTPRQTGAAGFSAQAVGLPGQWLYRVVDDKLTVALDLEDRAAGREPVLETYVKIEDR